MSRDADQDQKNSQIGDRLLAEGACTAEDIRRALQLSETENARIERVLLRLGLVDELTLGRAVCACHGTDYIEDCHNLRPDRGRIQILSPAYLSTRLVAPVLGPEGAPLVLMADPGDQDLLREIEFHLGEPVRLAGAPPTAIRQLLASAGDARVTDADIRASRDQQLLRSAEAEGPVIRYVQEKLSDAVLAGASDVHFESTETGIDIRCRINGRLQPQIADRSLDPASVIARLKVLAEVNVAERRLPQDGRFTATIAGRTVDFRFSSLPTHWGESIVCRVLDPRALRLGWTHLGLPGEIVTGICAAIERPSGLFLVTGPTGSGKTTTLYTALAHLNSAGRKIVTVEDPVEYNLKGVQQVQVNEAAGLSFARVLRGVLRHDPDVILVGEIRDEETAEIACRAAQVGRLVLSTLHTNSAAGAVTRLTDLGVPGFIVSDVLRGVLAQVLTPVPCTECHGAGCRTCGGTGVSGRRPQAELLVF